MNGRKIWMNGRNNFFIRRKNLEGIVVKGMGEGEVGVV